MYDRVRACEACVVISETVKKVFMYVVLSDHCIYLTENPPKTIQAAVHFKDISGIELEETFCGPGGQVVPTVGILAID
ncbi:UNVERIFIED_CONTAM: hypothetical protein FKN15_036908 [Acipenser sinensis]